MSAAIIASQAFAAVAGETFEISAMGQEITTAKADADITKTPAPTEFNL